jgi:predicted Na+-dependent transporter
MDIAELLGAVFNVVLVVFIVATMVSAGFTTTFENLGSVLRRWSLVLMVLFTTFILRPTTRPYPARATDRRSLASQQRILV